jgi:hypothetical protein
MQTSKKIRPGFDNRRARMLIRAFLCPRSQRDSRPVTWLSPKVTYFVYFVLQAIEIPLQSRKKLSTKIAISCRCSRETATMPGSS